MSIINYDMSGFTSRAEALTMLNVLRDQFTRATELLNTEYVQDFVKGA
jgi:hypothetical protein